MRGAFGLTGRVGVGSSGDGVRVGPNNAVGDGPPVMVIGGGVGVTVGETFSPGVLLGVMVKVGVNVGRSVGTKGWYVAPQPTKNNPTTYGHKRSSFKQQPP